MSQKNYDPSLEDDVQWVFVKEFRLDDQQRIIIKDEEGRVDIFDIATSEFQGE